MPGGYRNDVEQLNGFVHEDGEVLFCAEYGDSSTNVPGERLHVFERNHLSLARTCSTSQFFEVEFRVTRDNGEDKLVRPGGGEQCFEDLFHRQANLFGYVDCGEVFRVDLVFLQREGDTQAF